MLKDLLEYGDQLHTNIRRGGCEDWDEALPQGRTFFLGDQLVWSSLFAGSPSSSDAVFQVYDG
jgi:hypothetical protein